MQNQEETQSILVCDPEMIIITMCNWGTQLHSSTKVPS